MADQDIDLKGLSCPMPIVKISKAMNKMAPGQTLRVEASDPAFQADLEAWAHKSGNKLLEFTPGTVQAAVIEKAS